MLNDNKNTLSILTDRIKNILVYFISSTRERSMLQMQRPAFYSAGATQQAVHLIPTLAVLAVFFQLNWTVISQPPYYDEMWRLDLIIAPNTIAKYYAHDTPIPIGWLFLNKVLLYFTPDNFAVARLMSLLWLISAIGLLSRQFSPPSQADLKIIFGVAFLGTCLPVQAVIRNFNQYSFEIFYSIAIIYVASRPIGSVRLRLLALSLIAACPLFATASMFFVPGGISVILCRGPSRRERIEALAAALTWGAITVIVYLLWYRPIIIASGASAVEFWKDHLVLGSVQRLAVLLNRAPDDFASSLTLLVPPTKWTGVVSSAVLFTTVLGFTYLWKMSRQAAIVLATGVVAAFFVPFAITWPLVFVGDHRINLGWLWVLYFCFGIGVAVILSSASRPRLAPAAGVAALIVAIALGPTWRRYEPDYGAFRNLYKDIVGILSERSGEQLIVQLHYMAYVYPEFLVKTYRLKNFSVLQEKRVDPLFLKELPSIILTYPNVSTVWLISPFERGPDAWNNIEAIKLPGLAKATTIRGLGSNIRKFER